MEWQNKFIATTVYGEPKSRLSQVPFRPAVFWESFSSTAGNVAKSEKN